MPMLKQTKSKISRFMLILLIATGAATSAIFAEPLVTIDTQEKIDTLSETEKIVLEQLYTMAQEINTLQLDEQDLTAQLNALSEDIKNLEAGIEVDQAHYAKNRDTLAKVLMTYQKMGPGSFLEILLDSDSLVTFLRRLNTLRDLTHNTGRLMDQLDADAVKLNRERATLSGTLALVEGQKTALLKIIDAKVALKNEQEDLLASLKSERSTYEAYLQELVLAWSALMPIFTDATEQFSQLAQAGSLPPEALEVSFTPTNILGTIKEEAFNDVVKSNPGLPRMVFDFKEGEIQLSVPDHKLVLYGTFEVETPSTLKFVATEGTFYDLPLEARTIEELFQEGYLILDLIALVGENGVEATETHEGTLVLIIQPNISIK